MANAGLLSKGTTLSYIENGNVKTIAGVRSIPTVGSDPEKVDVTNLGSSKKRYVKGLQDVDNLEFNVIYKGENFKDIHRLVELDKTIEWLVSYPDGMTVKFAGEVMLKIDGVEVNAAVGFSIVIVVSDGPNIEVAKEPQRPTELKANNIQFYQFNLSWSGSGLFRVYVDRQKVGETYNNTFTVKGLKPSTKHIVSVASASGINEVHAVPIEVTTTKLPKITKINVPQRLDLYVGETKQLDVSTVPGEAMRAYEHVNKAVLDNSIVKFDGDKVSGIKSVNDKQQGLNILSNERMLRNITIFEEFFNGFIYHNPSLIYQFATFKVDNLVKSHKYFVMSEIIFDDNYTEYVDKIKLRFGENASANWGSEIVEINKEKVKKLNKLSKVVEISEEENVDKFVFSIHVNANQEKMNELDAKVGFKNYKVVDLTELYGKGNEPTEEWCVNNIKWTPQQNIGYSYTNANVTFNDDEKSSAEFDIFVHERKRMTSPTESDTASFIL